MRILRSDRSPIELQGQSTSGQTGTATGLPRLWRQLSVEKQRQLAQQIGRLLQRSRQPPAPIQETEEDRADHDVVF
jgi:hypothetical protein